MDQGSQPPNDERRRTEPPQGGDGTDAAGGDASSSIVASPSITLPKGGGAIRGIGEKFATNPVTGTAAFTVPLPISPGRAGFGPELSLSYDSGAGNGPLGLGWQLSLPSITRKTDKGLPRYRDDDEDVFILAGSEDLVPALNADRTRHADTASVPGVRIERYYPRIEGQFARIERWTDVATGQSHWRTLAPDNVTSIYGRDDDSRIVDRGTTPGARPRVFSWLLDERYDDRGNTILYTYKREDTVGVPSERAHEANRADAARTTNRYLKRVRYANTVPRHDRVNWAANRWLFELVFDYGEHDPLVPVPDGPGAWLCRRDAFSSCKSGFEVRTYRLCQRVLMFHHFENEPGVGLNCLVRSLDLEYRSNRGVAADARLGHPVASFIASFTQAGYRRDGAGGYIRRRLPPLELTYTIPAINDAVETLDGESLENLPTGLDSAGYQWVDLFGEGVSGVLTEQAGAWFYKRNLSPAEAHPAPGSRVRLAPIERVANRPNASLAAGAAQLLDLEGDGQPDVVLLAGATPGFFELGEDSSWGLFQAFQSRLNLDPGDPNLRFIDLDGDGRADALVTEDHALTWYASLGERGFDAARTVAVPPDEDRGPRVVFADGTQSIYLADMTGDGLTDLVRVRNGEVCYWPNLGYGRFGPRVLMDASPIFDRPDAFDQRRVRLADIDGSGTTDIIYLAADGVRIFFNQSGNTWSDPQPLATPPDVDNIGSISTIDLFGNGTACLVWSSPLPGNATRQVRYIDLMGGTKPHLLTTIANNLGAETHVTYASSATFYVRDRLAGRPWITRLPFPVHVVERVETIDRIATNRFVTRYAYHHGHFDGVEREFRGFGLVEQWDTEELAALADPARPPAANLDAASHVPPAWTKTWFHTGVYAGRDRISNFHAGLTSDRDRGEYYREPTWRDDDIEAAKRLLDDTVLPPQLTMDEEREACRALRGSMLRQEIYGLDGSGRAEHPYKVLEQNFTVEAVQRRGRNRHAVFFVHPREALDYQYERRSDDPRVIHTLTLDVDAFGNVLRSASLVYGRRQDDPSIPEAADRVEQRRLHATCTENRFTAAIATVDAWRTPLPSEARTFHVTGLEVPAGDVRLGFDVLRTALAGAAEIRYETVPALGQVQKRAIDHVRTIYRRNNLAGPLPLHEMQSMALPYETYSLAYTSGLVDEIFGGRVAATMLAGEGGYVHGDGDTDWWIPSGRRFYSPGAQDTAADELVVAQQHFFLPRRSRDPFHTDAAPTDSFVDYDGYDLLVLGTHDALQNRMTVGERDMAGAIVSSGNDYRVLQPFLVTDPNGNRMQVAFDALGAVVGTAVMGKRAPAPREGDSLDGFVADLDDAVALQHLADPLANPLAVLGGATARFIYDVFAYFRTRDQPAPQPPVVCAVLRETHDADAGGNATPVQHKLTYANGFGREIQKKVQTEAGPAPRRDANGGIVVGADGRPEMVAADPRWVGSGWTIYNNKGNPVREFEPFFSDTPRYEADVRVGVSPIVCYDPLSRAVATLYPNHTWNKVVFDAWSQTTWDVNDTVLVADPALDPDVGRLFERLPPASYSPTWFARREGGALGVHEQTAARQAAVHAATPARVCFDALGRPFVTYAHNRYKFSTAPSADPPLETRHRTRLMLDIEGNQREVIDPAGRTVARFAYALRRLRAHQASMEGGSRWTLHDVSGRPIRAWDSRGHVVTTEYDRLRRRVRSFVRGTDAAQSDGRTLNPANPSGVLVEQLEYGEGVANDTARNLRTRVFRQSDSAGQLTTDACDFKGNIRASTRQIPDNHRALPDWSGAVALLAPGFTTTTTYDALNRPTALTAPERSMTRPRYNEANLLIAVDVNVAGEVDALGRPIWTPIVTDVDYDANGQRIFVRHANGVESRYRYDRETHRLASLYTRRGAGFTDDCDNPAPPPDRVAAPEDLGTLPPDTPCGVQNLRYTYDPTGNVTHVHDVAQPIVYFRNQRITASAAYTYDALYRLIEATGREHLGQAGGPPLPHSYNDVPRAHRLAPGDGAAFGRYLEQYEYDLAGNIAAMIHRGSDPQHDGWRRSYDYDEDSQLGAGRSNRLTSTAVGAAVEIYSADGDGYDAHGNMRRMPHLQAIQWDFADRLHISRRQAIDPSDEEGVEQDGEQTWYVYDAGGSRVRKVTELAGGGVKDDRIYAGHAEFYRRFGVQALTRETLHVTDDKERIACIETRTDGPAVRLTRFQHGNHLGSVTLELDAAGEVISYEEYLPYGSSAYEAVRSRAEAAKRYRFTHKERDEQSGLYYHGARYYAPWLGRWVSPDPASLADGLALYSYVNGNPLTRVDPDGLKGKKIVHLTFDDGPRRETTPKALDHLDAADVKATFYIQGNHVKGNEDILFDILERGHFIGNHTFTHPTFADKNGKALITNEEISSEFTKTEQVIKDALVAEKAKAEKDGSWEKIPQERRDYIDSIIANGTQEYRVPQFSQSKEQTKYIEDNFRKPRAANVDSKDADTIATSTVSDEVKTSTTVSNIVNGKDTSFKGVRDQSSETVIVLQHDTLGFSVDAIPGVIQKLKDEGHTFGGKMDLRSTTRPAAEDRPFPPLFVPQTPDAFWHYLKWKFTP